MAPVLKTGEGASLPGVRIPPHPPNQVDIIKLIAIRNVCTYVYTRINSERLKLVYLIGAGAGFTIAASIALSSLT